MPDIQHGRYWYRFRKELIERLTEEGATVSAIFPFDEYVGKLESLGVQCFDLDAHGIGPLKQIALYRNLKSSLAEINPDKVLSFTIKPVIFTSILAKAEKYRFSPMITGIGRLYIRDDFKTQVVRSILNAIHSCQYVSYVGLQKNMQEIYSEASVFVLPSYRKALLARCSRLWLLAYQ